MSRTIQRKSPEFNASNDQNVILSKTVLKVKLVLPPSLEILEILKNIVFSNSSRDTIKLWRSISLIFTNSIRCHFIEIIFHMSMNDFSFWTVWHLPIWWHMICNKSNIRFICLRHGDINRRPRLGVAAGQSFERPSKLQSEKNKILHENSPKSPFNPKDGRIWSFSD